MGHCPLFFRNHAEDPTGDLDMTIVYACAACRIFGVDVPGIAVAWRQEAPGIVQQLLDDAWEGLRQRHFLMADSHDPVFLGGGW